MCFQDYAGKTVIKIVKWPKVLKMGTKMPFPVTKTCFA